MDKTVIFRIGSDKAGTMSLARFFEQNRRQLAVAGVFAPLRNSLSLIDHFVKTLGCTNLNMFDSSRLLAGNPIERTMLAGFLADRFWEQFAMVYLTTEVLWGRLTRSLIKPGPLREDVNRLLAGIRDFFPHHKVLILLHLRRGDLYFESLYNQHIKAGATDDMATYWAKLISQNRAEKSLDLIDLLEACFGRENIIVKPFERDQFVGGDLLEDTLRLLGIDPKGGWDFGRDTANERLHRLILEALPTLNQRRGKILSNTALLAISSELGANPLFPNPKFLLTRAERANVIDHFAPFYAELSSRYFHGRQVFLEPFETLPEPDPLPQTKVETISRILLELGECERLGTLTRDHIKTVITSVSPGIQEPPRDHDRAS